MAKPLMGLGANRGCEPIYEDTPASSLEIQGSVGNGGKNNPPDVRRIQEALNQVPANQGGPQPPLEVDGLVGPKTVSAIFKFQQHHFGPAKADGRVDPNQYTIAKLREFQANQPAVGTALAISPGLKKTLLPVMDRVRDAHPEAQSWVRQAIQRLHEAEKKLTEPAGPDFELLHDSLQLVDRCFKVIGLGETGALKAIRKIRPIYKKMQTVLEISTKVSFFHPAPGGCNPSGKIVFAWTFHGGFTKRDPNGVPPMSNPEFTGPNVPQNGIYMCEKNVEKKSRINLTDDMVHELAHFVGPDSGHFKIEDHSYGLAALNSTHELALRTASNYAWLAWLARLPRKEWLTNNG